MTDRDRLGKGLGALLGDYMAEGEGEDAAPVRSLALGSITPNPFQPRRDFEDTELDELARSLDENGLLQPVVVRPSRSESSAEWELVAGERRWRAATRLGWAEIPAFVREVDDQPMLVLALVENLQREALSPLEEATAYQQLVEEFGLTQKEVAHAVGRDRSTVANTLRLLALPVSVRRLLDEGRLSAGHARALLGLDTERAMADLGRRAADEEWNVRTTEKRVQQTRAGRRGGKKKKERERTRDAAERRLEEELQRVFGTGVRIKRTRGTKKGNVEIPFYGPEDFERIFELLVGTSATDVVS